MREESEQKAPTNIANTQKRHQIFCQLRQFKAGALAKYNSIIEVFLSHNKYSAKQIQATAF